MKNNIVKLDNTDNKVLSINKKDIPKLTLADIKKYINPLVTDKEAYMFLQLCKSQKLNPFIKEAYLIKYNTNQAATMVVGKDVFTKRASHLPQFNGFKAGIIVISKNNIVYREGSLFLKGREQLIGGWAEVYRKDREVPFRSEVSMEEYNVNQASWKKMPATMIRKVALVQALREAFPDDFGGLYDAAEMGIDLDDNEIDTEKPQNIPKQNLSSRNNIITVSTPKRSNNNKTDKWRALLREIKQLTREKNIATEDLKSLLILVTNKDSFNDLSENEMEAVKESLLQTNIKEVEKEVVNTDISDITEKVDWLKENPGNSNFESPIDDNNIPFNDRSSLDKDLTESLF